MSSSFLSSCVIRVESRGIVRANDRASPSARDRGAASFIAERRPSRRPAPRRPWYGAPERAEPGRSDHEGPAPKPIEPVRREAVGVPDEVDARKENAQRRDHFRVMEMIGGRRCRSRAYSDLLDRDARLVQRVFTARSTCACFLTIRRAGDSSRRRDGGTVEIDAADHSDDVGQDEKSHGCVGRWAGRSRARLAVGRRASNSIASETRDEAASEQHDAVGPCGSGVISARATARGSRRPISPDEHDRQHDNGQLRPATGADAVSGDFSSSIVGRQSNGVWRSFSSQV